MGNPYVQLLPLVSPDAASADFAQQRGSPARTGISYTPTIVPPAASGHTLTLASDVAGLLGTFGVYLPAVLGMVALNTLVLTALLAVGCITCLRGRRAATSSPAAALRDVRGRSRPASLAPSALKGAEHGYAPVSLAVPDDVAAPYDPEMGRGARMSQAYAPLDAPVPAFRRQNSLAGKDRPLTVA